MPMELFMGMANQALPDLLKARNSGWAYPLGRRCLATHLEVKGLKTSNRPGAVPGLHVGVGSQPGSATQILPFLSTAVPQGSLPDGMRYSVVVVVSGCACAARLCLIAEKAKKLLASNTASTKKLRKAIVRCIFHKLSFCNICFKNLYILMKPSR